MQAGGISPLEETGFNVVGPDTLVISAEFGNWDDSPRRIDPASSEFSREPTPAVLWLIDHDTVVCSVRRLISVEPAILAEGVGLAVQGDHIDQRAGHIDTIDHPGIAGMAAEFVLNML